MVTTTDYWAAPPMRRDQCVLFAPTLDDMIATDDPVRLVDEVLAGRDWADWEAEYDLTRGQPPIHPRHLAACLLYGMARGIRSSRKLEEACRYRVDFMWLPPELADLNERRKRVRDALEKARAADAARRKQGVDPAKHPAQVPTTDPDSRVMPNKEAGYAPNYTPTAITDGHRGFIVDADVTSDVNEGGVLLDAVERIEQNFGALPEKLLTDAGNNAGHLLAGLESLGVEAYAPVESNQPQAGNPARRDGATQPVPEPQWPQLPRNDHDQLAKSCFVYDADRDLYHCPQGHALPLAKTKQDERGGAKVTLRVYQCASCSGCPLASACLSPQARHGRTITRDPHEAVRERVAARMTTEPARKLYDERPRIAETTFGILKHVMGLRQFLLRGLSKVRTEWT